MDQGDGGGGALLPFIRDLSEEELAGVGGGADSESQPHAKQPATLHRFFWGGDLFGFSLKRGLTRDRRAISDTVLDGAILRTRLAFLSGPFPLTPGLTGSPP